jgi:hypothetical protein
MEQTAGEVIWFTRNYITDRTDLIILRVYKEPNNKLQSMVQYEPSSVPKFSWSRDQIMTMQSTAWQGEGWTGVVCSIAVFICEIK